MDGASIPLIGATAGRSLAEVYRILRKGFFARIKDAMAFRVFLSYSLDPAEIALAWRLQTLAAAHGIEMYVPQHGAGNNGPGAGTMEQAIDRADCVLAIITTAASQMVQNELGYALEREKLVIPIVRTDLAGNPLLAAVSAGLYLLSVGQSRRQSRPRSWSSSKSKQLTKEKQQTIGALAALGLGLLVLFSLNKE